MKNKHQQQLELELHLMLDPKLKDTAWRHAIAASSLLLSKVLNLDCSVKKAMIFAHTTTEEVNDRALQRRVMRCKERMRPVLPHTIDVDKPAEPVATEKVSGLTSNTSRSSRVAYRTRWKSNDLDTARAGNSHGKKRTTRSSNTCRDQGQVVTLAATAMAVPVVKCCRTAKAIHSIMVRKQQNKNAIELAYLAVMNKIRYEQEHVPEKERQTVVSIVDQVDRRYDTSLTPETTRRRLKLGLEAVPPRVGGRRKPTFPFQLKVYCQLQFLPTLNWLVHR